MESGFGYFYVLTAFPSTPYKMRNNERMFEASKIVDELEDKMLNRFSKGDIVIINMRHGVHFRGGTEKWLFVSEEGSFVEKPDKSYYFNQWKNNLQVFAKKADAKGVNFIIFTAKFLWIISTQKNICSKRGSIFISFDPWIN